MAYTVEQQRLRSIRDGKIVVLWSRHNFTKEEISERFKISIRRVEQILFKNQHFVEYNKDWEKKKRIQRLQGWLKNSKAPEANALTLQQEIRAELEGNAPGSGGKELQIIIVRDGVKDNGRAQNSSESVSRSISI